MLVLTLSLAAIATPTDVWLEHHRRERARWITEQDAAARAWVAEGDRLTATQAWLTHHRQAHEPGTYLLDRRDGASLWMVRSFLEDREDPRQSEWVAHLHLQVGDAEIPGEPLDVGNPEHPLGLSTLAKGADRATVVRTLPPDPDERWKKPRNQELFQVDLATGSAQLLDTGRLMSVTVGHDGHTWAQVGRRRAEVTHRDADGETLERFHWKRRTLLTREDGAFVAWRRGRVWAGESPRELELLLRSRSVQVLRVEDDQVVALTRRRGEGGEVVRVMADAPAQRRWRSLVAERPGADLLSASVHGDQVFTVWSRDGVASLEVQPYEGGPSRVVPVGGPWVGLALSRAWSDDDLTLRGWSPVADQTWAVTIVDEEPFLTTILEEHRDEIVMSTVRLPTPDGDVAVSLLHAPDAPQDGTGALWLYTYGGFGNSVSASLKPGHELFLAAGGSVGFVHARGGRERGEAWHDDAIEEHLHRTIDDVDAAAAGLIDLGWAAEGRVALEGASNGGLTVTATVARAPERYGAVVSHAGVYDLLQGPRWRGWWWPAEYGRPRGGQKPVLEALSPRHNPPESLPPTLIVAGAHDPVVPPRHSYALAAAWAEVPGGPLLLRVDGHGTHGGRKRDRSDLTRSMFRGAEAETVAFLLRALDLEVPATSE